MRSIAILGAGALIAGAIAVAGRYQIEPTTDNMRHIAWRLDRWTGIVSVCGYNTDYNLLWCDKHDGRNSNGEKSAPAP